MAETYHIYEYREIKGRRLATLVCGLRPSSRLIMQLNDIKITNEEMLLASILDSVNMLVWSKTKDGQANKNRPQSVLAQLTEKSAEQAEGFDSATEFELARKRIIEGAKNGE